MTPRDKSLSNLEKNHGDLEKKAHNFQDSHPSCFTGSWEMREDICGAFQSAGYTYTHFFSSTVNIECLLSKIILWIAEACFHFLKKPDQSDFQHQKKKKTYTCKKKTWCIQYKHLQFNKRKNQQTIFTFYITGTTKLTLVISNRVAEMYIENFQCHRSLKTLFHFAF